MTKPFKLLSVLFCLFSLYANASDTIPHPLVHRLGVSIGADYVPPTMTDEICEKIPKEDRIDIYTALPVNLRYSFSFTDPRVRNYLPGGYQGVSLGIFNFGGAEKHGISKSSRNIGYPFLAYIFQGGPFHKFNPNLSLDYEWNFGASFGWKPYSEENKYFNLRVGSRVNAYLHLGMNLRWKLNNFTSLWAGVAISHFSNGNTSFPNPGVNTFGLQLGMELTLNPKAESYPEVLPDTIRKRKLQYNISAWGSTRKRVYRGGEEPVLLPGHYACAGLSFSPMVRLNTWWSVGGAADILWDRSSDMKRNYIEGSTTEDIKFHTPSVWRQISLGVSVHGELHMPIFTLNVGCGVNLKAPWENRGTYQNITLKTYLCEHIFINIGYQLRNFHQQSCLMLGLGVTI